MTNQIESQLKINLKQSGEFVTAEGFRVKVSDLDNADILTQSKIDGVMKEGDVAKSGEIAQVVTKTVTDITEIQDLVVNADLRGAKINEKVVIPEGWVRKQLSRGAEYINPEDKTDIIRIMEAGRIEGEFDDIGNLIKKFPNYQNPYTVIKKGEDPGTYFDLEGNIVDQYSNEGHPLIKSITKIAK